MSWLKFAFRWDGRIRGGQLLVSVFGVNLVSTLASMALLLVFLPQDPVLDGWPADARFWSVWYAGQIPGIVATASLVARRLHDLGHSARWLIAASAYIAALRLVADRWALENTLLGVVLVAPLAAAAVWLAAAAGDPKDNRYGAVRPR